MNIDLLFTTSGRVNPNVKKMIKGRQDLYQYIKQSTKFVDGEFYQTLLERLFVLRNNITAIPACATCGGSSKFARMSVGYQRYCSSICSSRNPERKSKIKQTNINRYGGPAPMSDPLIKNKGVNTSRRKYGADYHQSSAEGKQSRTSTNLKKYGSVSSFGSKLTQSKSRKTTNERYGAPHYNTSTIPESSVAILKDKDSLEQLHHIDCLPLYKIAEQLGVSTHCVGYHFSKLGIAIKRFNVSHIHQQVIDIFDKHDIECVVNDRDVISPLELDLILPQHNIAIEVNGTVWHSEVFGKKPKMYHRTKQQMCHSRGYNLIHLYEHTLRSKFDIIESRLLSAVGRSQQTIYARNTTVVCVDNQAGRAFFDQNHIQGANNSATYTVGLIHNNVLVSVMCFGKPRYTADAQWELLRFCSAQHINVVGGASKLFKQFIRDNNPDSVISYADLSWSGGSVYDKLGFVLSHKSQPSYQYFHINQTDKLYHRSTFQKHKLNTLLTTFDPKLTEWDNMKNNGYDRIWDCGNAVWRWA